MAHSQGYLGEADIRKIQSTVSSYLAEESEKIILKDINKLRERVDLILNKVKLVKDKSAISRVTDEKEELMIESYLLAFKLREFLMEEEIDYRYYYTADKVAKVVSFKEKDLLKYMHIGSEGLDLASGARLKKLFEEQNYQQLLNRHYNQLVLGIQPVKAKDGKTFQVVHKYIMNKYGQMNPGLLNSETGLYQLFNMGHIYEAIDIAFTEAFQQNKENDYNFIEQLTYGKYLYHEHVEGVKGGDNPFTMTQIKSNSANLLKYSTLINILEEIKIILDKNISREELREHIEKLYIDKTKYEDINACEQMIDNAVQKIINFDKP